MRNCYGFKYIWLLFIALQTLFVSCHDDDGPDFVTVKAKRTVVFYIAAENGIETSLYDDVTEILEGANSLEDSCRVVIFIDDTDNPRIYSVDNTTQYTDINFLVPDYSYDEDFNSCSEEGFTNVMNYIFKHYSSESYGLVMCSHGSGWLPSTYALDYSSESAIRKSFGVDN
ncbi:MAG: hypothetical protein K6E54_01765 [Bacteroidaceae bacterium]|nr:hypothetical protein [Bacteroidaceae bacterium]